MATREPFPTQQLAILALCRLAEPIAFASILAYNYPYVRDIRGSPDNAAFYAGLLVSAFAVTEASTAVLWGMLSDRCGRKPIVLSGLLGVALSSLVFGLAENYWLALAARAIGGLLNGNVSVMQTMVAEMVKCPEHEPLAYSMIPFMWFFGSIIGSSMGALLAKPALLSPIFKETIFDQYPYLLPNLVAAGFIVFAVAVGTLFLKETRDVTASEKETCSGQDDEESPLLPNGQSSRHQRESVTRVPTAHMLRTSDGVGDSPSDDLVSGTEEITAPKPSPRWNRNMVLLILQLSLASYLQMVYGVLMPIYLVDAPSPGAAEGQFDPRGGIGFSVRQVGGVMSVNGFVAIMVQGVIFTPFVRRVGIWKSFVWLTVFAPLSYAVVPLITMVPRSHTLAAIYSNLVLQNFMNIIIYPCLLILLKDATPSLSILGQVNGVAMACCSGARTIAPPLAGYVYGAGGSAAGWWSITLVAVIAGLLVPTIRRPALAEEVRDESGD
ncbi:unnamed protein product [Clonostachys solani]|uniref:Major facilitator superfamily (MFS) profile domain-containing protein n=1 Tax=Clonostachys solani TaxID=160281 RepID=A0A9N9ZI70_9HYPO|nr:unnamed protein product [Clonostachys solani]